MDLGLDIDTKQTADNARHFFKNQWKHYVSLAGISTAELQSPSLDPAPKGDAPFGATETKFLKIIKRRQPVECVLKAISHCSAVHSYILQECYLNGKDDKDISQELCYSKAQYQRIKTIALCEFAEQVDYYAMDMGVDLPSLIVRIK